MPELKVPETGGVVIRALDETASTVQCLAQRDGSLEGPAGKERLDPTHNGPTRHPGCYGW